MTISQKIKETSQILNNNKISSFRLEAELIISFILKMNREKLIINNNKKINSKLIKKIDKLIKERITGQPLAYIIKEKNFYNSSFFVNKNTLIPRPESELIVEEAFKELAIKNKSKKIIIDVGTGSGCLIISLAQLFPKNNSLEFWGIDVSSSALKIARKNAKKYKLNKNIKFISGNLLKPLIKKIKKEENLDIIILANLPYLTSKEIKNSFSIKNEPYTALYGGKDGLQYYRQLLDQLKKIKNNFNNISIYQEISPWQKDLLKNINKKKLGLYNPKIKLIKDLNKKDRLLITKI